jgi:cyclic pyranopterin phosphate synthase
MITLGHLDVNVVTHCNMRCVSCSHAAPVNPVWQMETFDLQPDLARLAKVVHFQRIHLVGGEPTLHKNLPAMIRIARASGIANEVMVITNGKLLPRMPEDFWEELDTLQLSIYPTLDPTIPFFARAKCLEHGKVFNSTVYTEFHQQLRSTPTDGSNFHSCHWKSDCYTVHRGYFYLCPQSVFFPENFMKLPAGVDGLSLEGLTEEKFVAFLQRKEPLNACRICLANEMKPKAWAEAKRQDWVEASTLKS